MSIKAFPLNQQEYSYNAQDVMKYYAGRNSGVFETGDNLKVSANGGLELRINTGMGWLAKDYVASVAFWNESVEYLMVDAGHDTYNRIDLVVVSWNFIQQEQNPKLIIRKGAPASSPAVPSLVNDSSTIEIALARINVAKGAITLSDSNIVDLRGNDTYCPMVYDEQTIRNAFVNCVGYADGVKKISNFPSVTPNASDKILVENGGTGKSTTIKNAVNTCSLTLEEIQATTNLTGKVAGADSIKNLLNNKIFYIKKIFAESEDKTSVTFTNVPIAYRVCAIVLGNANGFPFFRYCTLFVNGGTDSSEQGINDGTISSTNNGDGTANITISTVNQWGYYHLIVFYNQII